MSLSRGKQIQFTLIENGLDFVLTAIKDYPINVSTEAEMKRILKYSVLHLSSGVELLLKSRLHKENWVYIFQDMNKANTQKYIDRDFVSVDSKTNIERLENICNIVFSENEKKDLEALRKIRNGFEHFDFLENDIAIETKIEKAVKAIINFVAKNLLNVVTLKDTEQALLDEIKQKIIEINIYSKELENLANEQINIDNRQKIIFCPECGKEFFALDDDGGKMKCYYCGWRPQDENDRVQVATKYLYTNIASGCLILDNGEQLPLYECPECGFQAFVIDDNYRKCFNCGYNPEKEEIAFCNKCNLLYKVEVPEDDIGICPECFLNFVIKD
ncbi:MAG: hypothetical protein PHQ62_00080 [Clostridia bacterium]|nr:hypothetical protein [Clostridia bacterium]